LLDHVSFFARIALDLVELLDLGIHEPDVAPALRAQRMGPLLLSELRSLRLHVVGQALDVVVADHDAFARRLLAACQEGAEAAAIAVVRDSDARVVRLVRKQGGVPDEEGRIRIRVEEVPERIQRLAAEVEAVSSRHIGDRLNGAGFRLGARVEAALGEAALPVLAALKGALADLCQQLGQCLEVIDLAEEGHSHDAVPRELVVARFPLHRMQPSQE
jgi:hypothetical protein